MTVGNTRKSYTIYPEIIILSRQIHLPTVDTVPQAWNLPSTFRIRLPHHYTTPAVIFARILVPGHYNVSVTGRQQRRILFLVYVAS